MQQNRFSLRDSALGYRAAPMMTNFKAAQNGDCFERTLARWNNPTAKRLGEVSIGLNPVLRVMEANGANYRPVNAAEMVWVYAGNNTAGGGQNTGPGGFGFPVTNATMEIGGKAVVRNGQLALGTRQPSTVQREVWHSTVASLLIQNIAA